MDATRNQEFERYFTCAVRNNCVRYALFLTHNQENAKDICQEAYFKAIKSFSSYRRDKSFQNWLYSIIRRIFLDEIRSVKRRVPTCPIDLDKYDKPDDANELEFMKVDIQMDQISQILADLPANYRQILHLRFVEDLSYVEISHRTLKSISAVKSRVSRALAETRAACECRSLTSRD